MRSQFSTSDLLEVADYSSAPRDHSFDCRRHGLGRHSQRPINGPDLPGLCVRNFQLPIYWKLPTTPPPPATTPSIAGGTVWADTLSDPLMAPTFQGYAFAICNFQFAHGFAFISDVGARNLAMGYLALVIPDVGFRDPSPMGLGGGASQVGSGEQEAH